MKTNLRNKAIVAYLSIVFCFCYLLGILEVLTGSGKYYQILGIGFTFIPVIAAAITRRFTGEKAAYHLSLRVWKNMKYWAGSFGPDYNVTINYYGDSLLPEIGTQSSRIEYLIC